MSEPASKSLTRSFWVFLACLLAVLAILFHKSFLPDYVVFSNDGPLGAISSTAARLPGPFTGLWLDLNWVGGEQPSASPTLSVLVSLLSGPLVFSKIYPAMAALILGLCAWIFFRRMQFTPAVSTIAAIAAALNGNYFSYDCWGLGSRPITAGMAFLALAALHSARMGEKKFWIKIALAGFAVGLGVMEAYDVGALFSLYVSAFAVFHFWQQQKQSAKSKLFKGVAAVVLMAVCAGFIATQSVSTLVRTQIKGVAEPALNKDAEAKWSFATQWSLPKIELLQVIVPGLFGNRMDTPDGGNYWGRVGQSPGVPTSRFSGAGEYAGVAVVLLAIFAIAQSFRKTNPLLSDVDRRTIRFWTVAAIISLLFAVGKYAPFYHLIFPLPFFSSMRNPNKFMHPFHLTTLILFGYGLQLLYRGYIQPFAKNISGNQKVVSNSGSFEKKWKAWTIIAVGVSVLGWLIYISEKRALEAYLASVGFEGQTALMSAYSIKAVGWFVFFLAISVALILFIMRGAFARKTALATILLGAIVIGDLARADLPWIVYWNYKEKYATNPVIDLLRQKPYLNRVAILPLGIPELRPLQSLYGIEWSQHHFQYYNIQSIDLVQEPRVAEDNALFRAKFAGSIELLLREWELTNTRYILGLGGNFVDSLNQQLAPLNVHFKTVMSFDMLPKPGIAEPTRGQDYTAVPNPNGRFALLEFTEALPRAKLYSNWQFVPTETDALNRIAEPNFAPQKSVVIATNNVTLPAPKNPTADAGSVEFVNYAPKSIELSAQVKTDSVLLLNDKFHPDWKAWVDGKPVEIFRANFLMRGIYLEPGDHKIVMKFEPAVTALYVSLAAVGTAVALLGILLFLPGGTRKNTESK